jgi:hypothetical protein
MGNASVLVSGTVQLATTARRFITAEGASSFVMWLHVLGTVNAVHLVNVYAIRATTPTPAPSCVQKQHVGHTGAAMIQGYANAATTGSVKIAALAHPVILVPNAHATANPKHLAMATETVI